jgi:hypothetical protein
VGASKRKGDGWVHFILPQEKSFSGIERNKEEVREEDLFSRHRLQESSICAGSGTEIERYDANR